MRIVVNGWFAGQMGTGSGQYLAGLLQWLPRLAAGRDLVLVTHAAAPAAAPAAGPHPAPPAGWRVVAAATPFDRLNGNLAKLWFEQVTFPRACRRLEADVALVPYWGSPWWQPCPLAVTIHDLIPRLLPAYRGGPLQRGYTWLVSHTARRAAAVLTDSEASRRDIIAELRLPAARVHAIHLASDPSFGPVTDRGRLAQVAERYHLPAEPFFLYLGGFDVRKNVVRVLEAYARLAASHSGAPRLVIAGKLPAADSAFAPDPRPVADRLGLRDAVCFTGWVDEADKPALYSLAAAALFISEYEGFGLPVLEAQVCGCPVITAG